VSWRLGLLGFAAVLVNGLNHAEVPLERILHQLDFRLQRLFFF
jgi:hypothetical protein